MNFKFEIDKEVIDINQIKKRILARAHDNFVSHNKYFVLNIESELISTQREDELFNYREKIELKQCPCCTNESIYFLCDDHNIGFFNYYDEISKDTDYKIICDRCELSTGFNKGKVSFLQWNNINR